MKRIISLTLSAVLIIVLISASVPLTNAVTYITYGDWLLAVNDDNSYLVGAYNGSETNLVFPETANEKPIVGVAEDFSEYGNITMKSVTIPDSYIYIGEFAFYGCTELETINIPSSLKSIGMCAFYGCTSLYSLDFASATGLNTIPYGCFSGCTSLESVLLPESITAISDYCFNGCSAIESITIPSRVTVVPDYAFSGCTSLEQIALPEGVTSVGNDAFSECTSLSGVELPAGLTSIGEKAFFNDTSLALIYVPASVVSIGNLAFSPMAFNDGGSMTIDCYANTFAAEYAADCELNYTNVSPVKGDADNNGITDINDVTYIQLYRVGKYSISSDAKTIDRVDVTGDSKITIRDATTIQLYLVGNIESL